LQVTWQSLEGGRIGSYRYRYVVLPDGQYRFLATDIILDARLDAQTLYRYALVQVGHAVGLLGRSPFEGDAMSWQASGIISERDIATLRALYAIPSGTVLAD
jgi:predicted Zn-dependent protease